MTNQTLAEFESIAQIAGVIVVLAGASFTVGRFVVVRTWRGGKRAIALWRRAVAGLDHVETVAKELRSNGGGSLRDQVVAIRGTVELLEARQRAVSHAIPAAIFETDGAGGWKFWNAALEDLMGVPPSDLVGPNWKNLIHVDDRGPFLREWSAAIRDGAGRAFDGECRMATSNGIKRVKLHQRPMFGGNGERLGWSGQVEVI